MRTGSADGRFEWVGLATVILGEKTPKGKGRKENRKQRESGKCARVGVAPDRPRPAPYRELLQVL